MEVEPLWNRLLLFWSDDRSPHEVLSACKDRTWAVAVGGSWWRMVAGCLLKVGLDGWDALDFSSLLLCFWCGGSCKCRNITHTYAHQRSICS